MPSLLLAYVWHVNDGQETDIFLLTYAEALEVLRRHGHHETDTWRNSHKYSIGRPSSKLKQTLAPFKIVRGGLHERLAKLAACGLQLGARPRSESSAQVIEGTDPPASS